MGMPHALCGIGKDRLVPPAITGPPNVPSALRVSATRQGVTGTKTVPAAHWVTITVWPATVKLVLRAAPVVLASTEKVTVPVRPNSGAM